MTFVNQDPILITSNSLQGRIVWLQSRVDIHLYYNVAESQRRSSAQHKHFLNLFDTDTLCVV